MRNGPLAILAVLMALVVFANVAWASGDGANLVSRVPTPNTPAYSAGGYRGARLDTFWIFDADFSDELGDNNGWTSYDRSGTLGQDNYWHHDTIRLSEAYLGESTWWCGTYNICWRQPRGYANEWYQILQRTMSEVAATTPGDIVELEFDQRYAMERNYDYGYVEVKGPADLDWVTLGAYNNTGYQGAGVPHNWNHLVDGHVTKDLSTYAGEEIELRFRFESDLAYSSQDQYDNNQHSVRDGAWQLDNIVITQNATPIFSDDSESGNMGWVHDPRTPSGQTAVQFTRELYPDDIQTGRPYTCENRIGWMYAAVDPFNSRMVEGEDTWLVSPAIDIEGAGKLVGWWDMWVDLPRPTNDIFNLQLASNDIKACVTDPAGFVDEAPGWWYGGPFWGTWTDDWDAFAGNAWLAIMWQLRNDEPSTDTPPHMAGIFLNRQRVGIPSGDAGTTFERDTWNSFNDWMVDVMADAFEDTAKIRVKDDDDIQTLYLMASNDEGATWSSYEAQRESPESDWWDTPPPADEIVAGAVIRYYWEATDGVNNVAVYPSSAPARYYEMSILPLDPEKEILLVDKHGRLIPGDERNYRHSSEYYFREALQILGYDWETYDVEVPSGSIKSLGPDSSGYKYYDTQIWFTDEFDAYLFWTEDQDNLISWLAQASEGKERNLLVTGNDIGKNLIGTGQDSTGFYNTWLASEYISNDVGVVTVDSIPGLEDHAAGWTFMSDVPTVQFPNLDGDCALFGGCPSLNYFDVVNARAGVPGNEVVADYCDLAGVRLPAGVAYTHPSIGYQTVNLGFGMEFMVDGDCVAPSAFSHAYYDGEGHLMSGIEARADLMKNILAYFGVPPDVQGTGVIDDGFRNVLSHAAPNPFNPVTKIAFSVKETGPVTIQVYNVAGRVVRTLLDTELEAGTDGYVTWNGTNDGGERCASGVYFYRIQAPSFTASRKMVMLK